MSLADDLYECPARELRALEAPLVTLFRRRDFRMGYQAAGPDPRWSPPARRAAAARRKRARRFFGHAARLPRQGLPGGLHSLDAARLRAARRGQGAGGLGDVQELGFPRGVHRALRVHLQPCRTPDRTKLRNAQRDSRSRRRTSFTSPRRARSSSGTISRRSSSPWQVRLLDALGHELQPERVKLEKLPDAYEIEFFPAKTPFSKTYSVRFVAPEGRRLRRA